MRRLTTHGFTIYHRNLLEARIICYSVFQRGEYKFLAGDDAPDIIDCGAHIGIATLYFKHLYPKARVIAIEANPDNVELLSRNVRANNLDNVVTVWGAVCNRDGRIVLHIDPDRNNPWSWGDSIVRGMWGPDNTTSEALVPAIKLSRYIDRPIDFLKLDIEGAEVEVMEEAASALNLVRQVTIEFHETSAAPRAARARIRKTLDDAGFSVKEYRQLLDPWLTICAFRA